MIFFECNARYSIVMVAVSAALGVYNYTAHEHDHPRHGLPYQRFRSKPYPWACSDCTLFDMDCWAECKGQSKPAH